MTMFTSRDRETIWRIIDFLISRRREITVQSEGHEGLYASRIIKASYMANNPEYGNDPHLIIGKLVPEDGYTVINTGQQLVLKFLVENTPCGFKTRCLNSLRDGVDRRFIVSFPQSMKLPERRRVRRRASEMPEFISAVLTSRRGLESEKNYDLPIVDYSTNGVGIFVTEEDSDLIESAQKGDRLKNITLFSLEAMINVDGTVRHKSKHKRRGRLGEESFILGIEFDEALMDFRALP
jgi:hypothetical protein